MTCTPACRKPRGRQAHCSACHRTFTTVSAFDHHRIGHVDDRSCADPVVRGMHLNAHGVWAREGGARFWTANAQPSYDTQTAESPSLVGEDANGTPKAAETLSGGWGDYPLAETYPGSGIYE